jgi:hypothetical protein
VCRLSKKALPLTTIVSTGNPDLWDRFSRDARTAPTRKTYLSTGDSLQSQGNANRFACGECLRCANADFAVPQIGQAAQVVSVETEVPLYSDEGACELVLLQNARPKVHHNNRRGRSHIAQNPVIRRVRLQPSRQCAGWGGGSVSERRGQRPADMAIFTLSGQLAPSSGLFFYQNARCSPSCPRPRVTVNA